MNVADLRKALDRYADTATVVVRVDGDWLSIDYVADGQMGVRTVALLNAEWASEPAVGGGAA